MNFPIDHCNNENLMKIGAWQPKVVYKLKIMDTQFAYLEIRGATGGDEAKLWGQDLLRMYNRFAVKKDWKISQLSETTIKITGAGAFDALKNESGVHRVQRVPTTQKKKKI